MLPTSCPLMSMSALQIAKDSGFSSCPYIVRRAFGFMAVRCSSAIESMPPVPAAGS